MARKNPSVTESVLKNSIWVFLLAALTKIGGLVFTILLARFLLPEGFGAFSLVLAIVFIIISFGDLGIDRALMVFFPKEKKKAKNYFKYLFRLKLIILLSIALISPLIFYFLSSKVFNIPNLFSLLLLGIIFVLLFSLTSFFASFFYIYRKVKLDFFKEILFQSLRLILILIVLFYLPREYYLFGVFISLILATLSILMFAMIKSSKLNKKLPKKSQKINKKRIWKFLIYTAIGAVSLVVFSEIDVFMLGLLLPNLSYLGYYKAVFAMVLGITGLIAFGSVLLPIFSSFKGNRIKRTFPKVTKYIFMISIPACFGILVLGRYFLRLLYGVNYLEGTTILYFLAFLIFSETTTNIFNTLISSREKPKFIAKSLFIAIILNIFLNYILITSLLKTSLITATIGAAIATISTRYFFMSSLIYYSKKEFNISLIPSQIIKPLISSIIMAAILSFIIPLIDINIFNGVLIVLLGIFLYFFIMLLIKGFEEKDFNLLPLIIPKLSKYLH